MAPPPLQLAHNHINNTTMSSPTINALASRLRKRHDAPSTPVLFSGHKAANIEKYFVPITIQKMEPLTSTPWLKLACYDALQKFAFLLVDAHPISDIIALVCDELLMGTSAALQESDAILDTINDLLFDLSNLTPVVFFHLLMANNWA